MSRLNNLDWKKWVHNSLIFLAPVAIIYLLFVQANLADGLHWEDFKPSPVVLGSMILYVVDILLDFFRKYKEA